MTAAYILSAFCMVFAFFKAFFCAKGQHFKEIACKCVASVLFVAIGICACALSGGGVYGFLMLGGAVMGLLGDVFLSVDDIAADKKAKDFVSYLGVLCFFAGHILYIAAFSTLKGHAWAISAAAVILPLAFIFVGKKFTRVFDNKLRGVFMCVYYLALGANIALGISHAVAVSGGVLSALIITGSVLFAFSDSMLGTFAFAKGKFLSKGVSGYIVILTYYPAQILLMMSIFFA